MCSVVAGPVAALTVTRWAGALLGPAMSVLIWTLSPGAAVTCPLLLPLPAIPTVSVSRPPEATVLVAVDVVLEEVLWLPPQPASASKAANTATAPPVLAITRLGFSLRS